MVKLIISFFCHYPRDYILVNKQYDNSLVRKGPASVGNVRNHHVRHIDRIEDLR